MKLESQVTSLELSKRLAKLGVKQESVFWWARDMRIDAYKEWQIGIGRLNDGQEEVSAYTVAELGEMLYGQELPHSMGGAGDWETSGYYDLPEGRSRIEADTEAEARGLMLEYLIKNQLMLV